MHEDDSPALRLANKGYAAVPQLIEALDDDRLTRSVECWRSFVYSHKILRVSDCAEQILKRIAGRSFYDGTGRKSRAEVVKEKASAWYAEEQRKRK